MGTKSAWTEERKARQRAIIRATRPWVKSTGPRTEEGKARSSQNARLPDDVRAYRDKLYEQQKLLDSIFGRSRLGPWKW